MLKKELMMAKVLLLRLENNLVYLKNKGGQQGQNKGFNINLNLAGNKQNKFSSIMGRG